MVKIKFKPIGLCLALFLSWNYAKSQEKETFSLKEATNFAIAHNIKGINSELDKEIAAKKVWETKSTGMPQIDGDVKFQNFIDIPTTVVPANAFNPLAPPDELVGLQFGTNYNLNGTIQVSQLIFNGNFIIGLQASKTYLSLTSKIAEKTKLEIKQNIAEAYYTVLLLKENAAILDSSLVKIKEIYLATKKLVNNKVVEASNAAQLELSVLQAENSVTKVKAQIELAKNLLKLQMGYKIAKPINLTDNLETFLAEANNELTETNFNPEQHIDYQILKEQLLMQELGIKNEQAGYLPSLAAFFSYQQVAYRNKFNFLDGTEKWYPTTLWGFNLSIPIFSSGMNASKIAQAKLEAQKLMNNLNQLNEGLQLELLQAITEYNDAKNIYQTQEKAVEVATTLLDNISIKYKEGVAGSMDVSQVHSQYLTTQAQFSTAVFNLLKAKLTIDKILNRL